MLTYNVRRFMLMYYVRVYRMLVLFRVDVGIKFLVLSQPTGNGPHSMGIFNVKILSEWELEERVNLLQ